MDIISFIEASFPLLKETGYRITSAADRTYNCIAWAADCSTQWWWPNEDDVWPDGVPRVQTIEAFEAMFATLGYAPCEQGDNEAGFEKVAIYAVGKLPKHAARQLPDGTWTSKLGRFHDIEHSTARGIESDCYGTIVRFLKRPRAK